MDNILSYQWLLVIIFGLCLFLVAPYARSKALFYKAYSRKGKKPGFYLLTSSLVISWIFAKSITNAANLGLSYGFVGGLAYSVYYFSFFVAGWIIYRLRTQGGFSSIHQFLRNKFGSDAILFFSMLIGFRMFNEVWSNTIVIGSYFGEQGSFPYYSSIVVFTTLTLAYVLKGGLRSSFITDMIQMILFGLLLFIILGMILPASNESIKDYASSGEWSLSGGIDLMLIALLQIFSYPFHDPVMTDRGFISSPKVTLRSFAAAAIIGSVFILFFSFIGIYARFNHMEGQAAVEVSKTLGVAMMLLMNFIMITSASSTLDSTFASFSKLIAVDLKMKKVVSLKIGRVAMIALAFLGTIPIFLDPEILTATTISGTMVIGFTPVFLLWKLKVPKVSFFLSLLAGIAVGFAYAIDVVPHFLWLGDGKYAALLGSNLWGSILCFLLYLFPLLFTQKHSLANVKK
jgi:Na+/proline symporter